MGVWKTLLASAAIALTAAVPTAAGQAAVTIDGDDITMSGCVLPANTQAVMPPDMLAWSRSGLLMAAAAAATQPAAPVGTSGASGRVFYWLDEDLSQYVGRLVEARGELEDFETGEIEIEREDDFTEITLDVGDIEERARVPSAWLRGPDDDVEIEIVARRIDVDEVRVIGVCGRY